MSGNSTKVNYSTRPSKCIERKMICDAISRLQVFQPIKNYRYIGFGAIYFTDFLMLHKYFGIHKMISIEEDESNFERYTFNNPLKCIQVLPGKSTIVLPDLDWDNLTPDIVWLDYHESFEPYMLEDIEFVTSKMSTGSLILFSCNRTIARENQRLEYMKTNFRSRIPLDLTEADLSLKESHKVIKKIVDEAITKTLSERNSGLQKEEQYNYEQLFYFIYKDGAPMLTLGGIIFQGKDHDKYEMCNFKELEFLSVEDKNKAYDIDIPFLTYKEISAINKCLPCNSIEEIRIPGISKREIVNYVKLYKYYPYYMEIQSFN